MSTNGEFIREHIAYLRRQHARPYTIQHRRANLERLAGALPVDLIEADAEQLAQWQDDLVAAGRAVATVRCYTSHARCLYRWAAEHGRREDDPTRDLRPPRVPVGRARPIAEDDLAMALRCAGPRPRLRAWLVLAAFVGLRAGEIAAMRIEDVGDDLLDVRGKGGKLRTVPLPAIVRELLAPHVAGRTYGPVWVTQYGTRMRSEYVSRVCNEHLRASGVSAGITLHKLRHRFGTETFKLSKDARLVQDLLGHSSLATTQIYLAVSANAGRRTTDRLARSLKRGNPRKPRVGAVEPAGPRLDGGRELGTAS